MPFYYFDYTYLVLVLPFAILAMVAQVKVKSTFNKYAEIANKKGYTGADVARQLLSIQGISDVTVEHVSGMLSDHYDPRKKVLRLSDSVYSSRSIAAISVAAHETGHAVQHNTGYTALNIRNAIFPVASLSSNLAFPLILIGFLLGSRGASDSFGMIMVNLGIILFSCAVLFQLITLPVEFNASNRAIAMLQSNNILTQDEVAPAKKVLSAAAMTYVAAAAVALANLLRLIILANNRRRD